MLSGVEEVSNKVQVTLEFEGRLIGSYMGVDDTKMYIVEVLVSIPNAINRRDVDMMLYQYLIGRITMTVTHEDKVKGIVVDVIPESEYNYTNRRFYGGILPTPDDLSEEYR